MKFLTYAIVLYIGVGIGFTVGDQPYAPEVKIVDVTVFNAVESQTDSRPLETADGSIIDTSNLPRWAAVSRDLWHLRGKCITLRCKCLDTDPPDCRCPYDGTTWEVRDKMNARFRNRIDLLTTVSTGKYVGAIIY